MTTTKERLYHLLPAIYRLRDMDQDEKLRALLAVIESELDVIQADVENLYENWFVETADQWVLPYIGDMLGVNWLHDIYRPEWPHRSFNLRGYVADTIAYRRRKGTLAILEQLARDVTGWDAHAVEFFQLLATTQHLNHLRPENLRTPDLRDIFAMDLLDGPFERIAHTADVRRISQSNGKYNIPNIGIFLWRLENYLIEDGTAHPVTDPPDGRYTFDPLGFDIPLFNHTRTEPDISHLAEEINVQARLRRLALFKELDDFRNPLVDGDEATPVFFSGPPVLQIHVEGEAGPIDSDQILICDLSDWRDPDGSIEYSMDDGTTVARTIRVAVDPILGRIAFPSTSPPASNLEVFVTYSYGFSSDIGGGSYDRRYHRFTPLSDAGRSEDTVADPEAHDDFIQVITKDTSIAGAHQTLTDALNVWTPAANDVTVIQVEDSRTYEEDLTINMAGAAKLVIQAKNNQRPVLVGNITVNGSSEDQTLILNGLVIAGVVHVKGNLGALKIEHCTSVPGLSVNSSGQIENVEAPKLVAESTSIHLRIDVVRSIIGSLNVPAAIDSLHVEDSIIDAGISRHSPVLISGPLAPFPTISSSTPTLEVTIGDIGPIEVQLPTQPTSRPHARNLLQQAIRDAHSSQAFAKARVIAQHNRLVVLPGLPEPITIGVAGSDTTALELRLAQADPSTAVRKVSALIGGTLPATVTLTADAPQLSVRIGSVGPHTINLTASPSHSYSFAALRDDLHTKIRAAVSDDAFSKAMVVSVDNQLVIIPGLQGIQVIIETVSDDKTTLSELALESQPPAIASGVSNAAPGPITSLVRTTIFGRVYVKAIKLVSECIFTGLVTAQRLQGDYCVRFSYVPEGSRTPQRYRCQPEMALGDATDAAEEELIRSRVIPTFTSTRFGHPAYAQLRLNCAPEIRTGAEDGSEMGVFSHLRQPQRETNLRVALQEYLRFGLEAGILYVT